MKKDLKTVGVVIRFFTHKLPQKVGLDKEHTPIRGSGSVHVESNKNKKLTSTNTVSLFSSMKDLPKAIEKSLTKANIVVTKGKSPTRGR